MLIKIFTVPSTVLNTNWYLYFRLGAQKEDLQSHELDSALQTMASKIFNDKSISVNGNLLKLLALQKLQDLVENNKQVRCQIYQSLFFEN